MVRLHSLPRVASVIALVALLSASLSSDLAGSIASGPPASGGIDAATKSPGGSGSPEPSGEPSLPSPSPPAPAPFATPPPAPASADGFAPRRTVVELVFPLPEEAKFRYADDWLVARVGRPYAYNHVRLLAPGGPIIRAHDGIDIHVALGTPVRAPFSGTVIDPSTRWRPWPIARYGITVVIVSDELASPGYTVILAHLLRVSVAPGDHVISGQRVGLTGHTGNAAGQPPHLHIELRAPFLIPFREGGKIRKLDAFDPYRSLLAADPHRRPVVPRYRWQEV